MEKELVYSGKVTAQHPVGYEKTAEEARSGLQKQWVLDAQWSDLPVEAEEEISDIWGDKEFGNDNYIYKTNLKDLRKYTTYVVSLTPQGGYESTPISKPRLYLVDYLMKKGVKDDETVWIHWWW